MSWKTWRTALPLAAVCLGLLTVAGCGPTGAPKTVAAKLKAQTTDGKALPMEWQLDLHPEASGAGYSVFSGMPVNGEYTLGTTYKETELQGAPPGKYKVVVRGAFMGGAGGGGTEPAKECTDVKTTPLTVEISDSGTVTPDPLKVPLAAAPSTK
jgi:hypothetical protein